MPHHIFCLVDNLSNCTRWSIGRGLKELAHGTPTSSSTQVGIPIARHNLLGKKFDTGCRERFGNLHAFPTSEILHTKYDREITIEKEAKVNNQTSIIAFLLH